MIFRRRCLREERRNLRLLRELTYFLFDRAGGNRVPLQLLDVARIVRDGNKEDTSFREIVFTVIER